MAEHRTFSASDGATESAKTGSVTSNAAHIDRMNILMV
jgi:hypothetical protein